MDCPRDQGPLSALDTGQGVTVDYCDHCSGVWYDAGEFEAVFGRTGVPRDTTKAEGVGPACPKCGEHHKMIEIRWPAWGNVLVDVCANCDGLWLDGGEAARIQKALKENPTQIQARVREVEVGGKTVRVIGGLVDETGLHWRWVVYGLILIVLSQVVLFGALEIYVALGELGDEETLARKSELSIAGLLGFALGGFLIGRFSPGFTVWEPALAAIPSCLLFALLFHANFSALALVGLMVGGFVLTLLAASFGERKQAS